MESRRKFLKKLGLGSLVVAAAVSPIIAHAVTKGQELNFDNPEQLLCQEITVFRSKYDWGAVGKAFRTRKECEWDMLLQSSGWDSNPIGALNNWAYMINSDNKDPKDYIKNIVEEKITLKQYLLEIEDGMDGYITK